MAGFRITSAVVAALAVVAAIDAAGFIATAAVFGVKGLTVLPPAYMVSNIVVAMAAAGAGGYVGARLAPAGRVSVTVGVLFAVYLALGVLIGRAEASALEPAWYQAVVALLGACGMLSGVVTERAWDAARRRA